VNVCIVAHSAKGFGEFVGGSERQSALLARALTGCGHDVTYVVTGLAGGDRTIDGVRLRAAWDPEAGVRFLRAATHRYPRLLRLLRNERADVYYARGAGYYTPFAMRAARDVEAASILALASDKDLYAASGKVLFKVSSPRVSALIGPVAHAAFRRWGLRAADCVAVQNDEQAASCAALGLPHAVLPSIVEPPAAELLRVMPVRDVIWVGNVFEGRRSKGLDELVALAELLPQVTFTVVGILSGDSSRAARSALAAMPNVELVGQLAHDETQRRLAEHRLVINTSPSEGFSNVMLEGWALGIPSVTLAVNPSGLLLADRLGICAGGDPTAMAAAVAALLAEPAARDAMGRRCREYVARVHGAEGVVETFEAVTSRARRRPSAPASGPAWAHAQRVANGPAGSALLRLRETARKFNVRTGGSPLVAPPPMWEGSWKPDRASPANPSPPRSTPGPAFACR
jgi:glycosyltransferase involved in cell wall biosynthesis